jgi:hypothetical protein
MRAEETECVMMKMADRVREDLNVKSFDRLSSVVSGILVCCLSFCLGFLSKYTCSWIFYPLGCLSNSAHYVSRKVFDITCTRISTNVLLLLVKNQKIAQANIEHVVVMQGSAPYLSVKLVNHKEDFVAVMPQNEFIARAINLGLPVEISEDGGN